MKFQIAPSVLSKALAQVGKSVAGKSTLPVLSAVHVVANEGQIRIEGTNLDTGQVAWIAAKTEVDGATCIPFDHLSNVIGSCDAAKPIAFELEPKSLTMTVVNGNKRFTINCLDADEFPIIPSPPENADWFEFTADQAREALGVVYATARDDTRPALAGVLFRVINNRLTTAASDSYRLAVKHIQVGDFADHEVVLTNSFVRMVEALGSDVRICYSESKAQSIAQVGGDAPTLRIIGRMIETKYPAVERVIPSNYKTRIGVAKAPFLAALKPCRYVANKSSNIVRLHIGQNDIRVSANAPEVGEAVDILTPKGISGETDYTIAFNISFLSECLSKASDEELMITISSNGLMVIKPLEDETELHLVMPMTVR